MSKKVAIKDLMNALGEDLVGETDVQWNGLNIHVKKRLSVTEMLNFVNTVVSWCVDEDTGEYKPEWRVPSYNLAVIKMYTNLTLPKDFSKQYLISYCSSLICVITACVDSRQLESMGEAIDAKISYVLQCSSSAIYKQMSDVVNAFSQMQDVANEMFTEENVATVKQFMETVNDIDVSSDKALKLYEMKGDAEDKNSESVLPQR